MTTPAAHTSGLTRTFGAVTAVDSVTISIEPNVITGLLGRNGAGKTTLMQLLTGQQFASSGSIAVFGENPLENSRILERICFIKESQRYPDNFTAGHALRSASWFFANWDEDFAGRLVADFGLPTDRDIKKLSRGQLSAVGVIIGLASRADLTFFDEPYLGLDAVARTMFYDHLLADYSQHPRTIVLSTHLIDEVSKLLEHVIIIDNGRILVDEDTDDLRGRMDSVVGKASDVDAFSTGRHIYQRDSIGGISSAVVAGLSTSERAEAEALGLEVGTVSLQQLVVHLTTGVSS
ncbi:MAG: ABC transporter ATP-binding protein [Microbacteriaceae bacterium]